MAISPQPQPDKRPAEQPANDPGIVSVNDRTRRPGSRMGSLLLLGLLVAVVLIGGLLTANIVTARLAGPKPKPVTTSSLMAHKFATDEPAPPLPGAAGSIASQPHCADGSAGSDLKEPDGAVIHGAGNQTVRVCPDGTVLAFGSPQTTVGGAIPVQASAGPNNRPTASSASPGRAAGQFQDQVMLNDGKYGSAVQVPDINDPQAIYAAAANSAQRVPARSEGLLTAPAGSMESQLIPSRTPLVQASRIGNLNMLLPKGRTIECGMSMRIVSSLAGQTSCIVTQNVYSANGKVVLIERGSEAVGEYRSGASIGQRRLFVLWTRIITPGGVVINLDSPGADELGSTGLTGRVDNHWFERIGSAFLLSTIQDTIQYEIAKEQSKSGGGTFILGNTVQAGNQIADRVLEQTINIPPTIYKNQGDRAVIYVARDLDFSDVYTLRPKS